MEHHLHTSGIKGYLFGFIASVILTLGAYYTVVENFFSPRWILVTIVVLGFTQAVVQLTFFLYLGKEPKPRTNFHVFLLMLLILSIVVGGTLWIMYSLNDRTMTMQM